MRRLAALLPAALAALAGLAAPRHAAAAAPPLSEEEKAFCQSEMDVVERRARIFQAQGLSAREIARKNEGVVRELDECRARFKAEQRHAAEEKADIEEASRRLGPNATEKERERTYREIRRERLASRSPSTLTAEERAELAAGMEEEVDATHAALDAAHAKDSAFMRTVTSALACYHGDRKDELDGQIASEQALVKLGSGDRQKLYTLRSSAHESEQVLVRSREAARGFPGGLQRCSDSNVSVLSHCLAVRFQGKRAEPACEAEEIQQYLRLVK